MNRLALLMALLCAPVLARADTTVAPSNVGLPQASTTAETSHVVSGPLLCVTGGGCHLHGASVTTGAAAGYFLILNAAADPGNGAVTPVKCVQVAANSTAAISADPDTMWQFPAGAVLVFSTTGCFTETQSATAFFSWQ